MEEEIIRDSRLKELEVGEVVTSPVSCILVAANGGATGDNKGAYSLTLEVLVSSLAFHETVEGVSIGFADVTSMSGV